LLRRCWREKLESNTKGCIGTIVKAAIKGFLSKLWNVVVTLAHFYTGIPTSFALNFPSPADKSVRLRFFIAICAYFYFFLEWNCMKLALKNKELMHAAA